MSLNSKLNW